MKYSEWSLNKKLALLAFILGFIAIFGGNPQVKKQLVVDTDDLANQIVQSSDEISVKVLAEKIIKEESDFRLIDLRDENKYNEYHIPVAENIKVKDFNDIEMPRNEKYYLISDNDVLTGQAWSLLKASGYKTVYIIIGGMKEWENSILFPKLSINSSPEEIKEFDKIKEISKFFGGQPQNVADSSTTENKIKMPKPVAPVSVPVKKSGKMKKEGC